MLDPSRARLSWLAITPCIAPRTYPSCATAAGEWDGSAGCNASSPEGNRNRMMRRASASGRRKTCQQATPARWSDCSHIPFPIYMSVILLACSPGIQTQHAWYIRSFHEEVSIHERNPRQGEREQNQQQQRPDVRIHRVKYPTILNCWTTSLGPRVEHALQDLNSCTAGCSQ